MKLKEFDTGLIRKRLVEKKMTLRSLQARCIEIDPEGKGVALSTIQRLSKGGDALPNTLCIVCAAIEISPGSLFVDRQEA